MAAYLGVVSGLFFWDSWMKSDELWSETWVQLRDFDIRGKLWGFSGSYAGGEKAVGMVSFVDGRDKPGGAPRSPTGSCRRFRAGRCRGSGSR